MFKVGYVVWVKDGLLELFWDVSLQASNISKAPLNTHPEYLSDVHVFLNGIGKNVVKSFG